MSEEEKTEVKAAETPKETKQKDAAKEEESTATFAPVVSHCRARTQPDQVHVIGEAFEVSQGIGRCG